MRWPIYLEILQNSSTRSAAWTSQIRRYEIKGNIKALTNLGKPNSRLNFWLWSQRNLGGVRQKQICLVCGPVMMPLANEADTEMIKSKPEKSNLSIARGITNGNQWWCLLANGQFCKKEVRIVLSTNKPRVAFSSYSKVYIGAFGNNAQSSPNIRSAPPN